MDIDHGTCECGELPANMCQCDLFAEHWEDELPFFDDDDHDVDWGEVDEVIPD